MTFAATLNPVAYEGGIPAFIDTEPDSRNMDPAAPKQAFTLYPDVRSVVAQNKDHLLTDKAYESQEDGGVN